MTNDNRQRSRQHALAMAKRGRHRNLYYHYLILRAGQGERALVIESPAHDIDEAAIDRGMVARRYHPHSIVNITTHDAGTGPACS